MANTSFGHHPEFTQLAAELDCAHVFNVEKERWERLSDTQKLALNEQFLLDAIAGGDSFVFSHRYARLGSYFDKELDFLRDQGLVVEVAIDAFVRKSAT